MADSSSSAGGGIGFAGLLTIVFITLKLTHYIDWSWVWILSPLWIGFGIAIAAMVIFVIIAAIVAMFK